MNEPKQSADAQSTGGEQLPVPSTVVAQAIPHPTAEEPAAKPSVDPAPPSVSGPKEVQDRAQFAEQVHQYIREYIRFADQKAGFFFAVYTALLAFLYRNEVSARWMKPVMNWNIIDTLGFIAMAGLSVSALLCAYVVIPRLAGSRRGYMFFEAIAEYPSARDYSDDIATKTAASLAQIKSEHCYDLAKVCRSKYKMLRVALWAGSIGLAASLAVLLFS